MSYTEDDLKRMLANKHVREHGTPLIHEGGFIPPDEPVKVEKVKRGKGPNKTELSYRYALEMEFPGCEPYFEGLTFKLKNGHRYTPDWVMRIDDDKALCVEVKARGKNGFRQPSYQRARIMFDQCRVEWPNYTWRWAEKCGGEWTIKDY